MAKQTRKKTQPKMDKVIDHLAERHPAVDEVLEPAFVPSVDGDRVTASQVAAASAHAEKEFQSAADRLLRPVKENLNKQVAAGIAKAAPVATVTEPDDFAAVEAQEAAPMTDVPPEGGPAASVEHQVEACLIRLERIEKRVNPDGELTIVPRSVIQSVVATKARLDELEKRVAASKTRAAPAQRAAAHGQVIEPGSVVQKKSGGAKMAVQQVLVQCKWFEGEKCREHAFPAACLRVVENGA